MPESKTKHWLYELIDTQDEGVEILKDCRDPLLIAKYFLIVYSPDKMTSLEYMNQVLGPMIQEREGYLFRIWFRESGPRVKLFGKRSSGELDFEVLKAKALDNDPSYLDSDCKRKHYQGRLDEIKTEIGNQIDSQRLLWQSPVKPHWPDSCCQWVELVDPALFNADFQKYRTKLFTHLLSRVTNQSKNFYKENKNRCNKKEIDKWQLIIHHLVTLTRKNDLQSAWLPIHKLAISAINELDGVFGNNFNWTGFGIDEEDKEIWVEKIIDTLVLYDWAICESEDDKANIRQILSAKNIWKLSIEKEVKPIKWKHPDLSILHYLLSSHATALNKPMHGILIMIEVNQLFSFKGTIIDFNGTHHQKKYRNCLNEEAVSRIDSLYNFLKNRRL
jgi:hypothetical protein